MSIDFTVLVKTISVLL